MIEPNTFHIVEACTTLRAFAEVEQLDEFVHRHQFLIVSWVPTEECQEIHQCLRQIALFAVTRAHFARLRVVPFEWEHRESQFIAIALRKFSVAHWLEEQRKMGKARHCVLPAKSLIQKHMERSRRQPFLTTNHVGNLHQVVIHDVCQVVSRQFISTLVEHLVVEDTTVNAHIATNQVIHMHITSWLNLKTNHILFAVSNQRIHLFLTESE